MGKNILTKELLLNSVEEWNAARRANPDLKPDLYGADLRRAYLRRANLQRANLRKAILVGADLREVNLQWADLEGANLCEADISRAVATNANFNHSGLLGANFTHANLHWATLIDANLRGADFSNANLIDADFTVANLSGADFNGAEIFGVKFSAAFIIDAKFNGAELGDTIFADVELSGSLGLDAIRHRRPSTIGIDTIYASKGNIPEVFLRGCGVPDIFIEYIHSLTAKAFDYYSCFISYSTKDDDFARRIHNDLQASGVRCWFAPHDIHGGKKVLSQIEEAIRVYDKLLLILSPDSMNSNWVETEIINALQKEQYYHKQVLFPIGIAPFEKIKQWKRFDSDSGRDLAREIREYHIPDFSQWGSDPKAYKTAFDRLLKDLKQ